MRSAGAGGGAGGKGGWGLYRSGGKHKPTAEACLQHTDGDQAPAATGSLWGEF